MKDAGPAITFLSLTVYLGKWKISQQNIKLHTLNLRVDECVNKHDAKRLIEHLTDSNAILLQRLGQR